MKILQTQPSAEFKQIEDFPKFKPGTKKVLFERSVEGALHFRPGATKVVTDDEWDHIQNTKAYKKFAARIIAIDIPTPPKKSKAKSADGDSEGSQKNAGDKDSAGKAGKGKKKS